MRGWGRKRGEIAGEADDWIEDFKYSSDCIRYSCAKVRGDIQMALLSFPMVTHKKTLFLPYPAVGMLCNLWLCHRYFTSSASRAVFQVCLILTVGSVDRQTGVSSSLTTTIAVPRCPVSPFLSFSLPCLAFTPLPDHAPIIATCSSRTSTLNPRSGK